MKAKMQTKESQRIVGKPTPDAPTGVVDPAPSRLGREPKKKLAPIESPRGQGRPPGP
jgi:hypothetical protein